MSLKKCSKCNKDFDCCTESRGCWCENYEVPAEALQELKKEFDNCLCEQCLSAYAVNKDLILQKQ